MEPSLFLQLPDLVREKITANLKITHLLNLRLVCWKTNEWALEELKSSMKSKYVYLNPQNIQEFNSTVTSLPFKSFCLAFRPPQLHTDPHLLKFLGNFASSLETLAVLEFHQCRSQEELSFYKRLISLKSLFINKIPLGNSSIPPGDSRLPLNCLSALRSVQILNAENSVDEVSDEVKTSEAQLLKLMRRQNVKLIVTKELINSFGGRHENSPNTSINLNGWKGTFHRLEFINC